MLSQKQILFGNKMLQEVAISWDVPILKAAKILACKGIDEFWKWINADEFLNFKLNETQDIFKEEKSHWQNKRVIKMETVKPQKYYGIYSIASKKFVFGIREPTKYKAWQKLRDYIGNDSNKWRFSAKRINNERH